MKKSKKFLKTPVLAIVLFVVAAALLITGGIGGTRAVLEYRSEMYSSRVQMRDIGVSLWENDRTTPAGWRNYVPDSNGNWNMVNAQNMGVLCEDLLGDDEDLKIGKKYDEVLYVSNTGNIPEYVRVTVYKYWADADGNKLQYLKDEDGNDLVDDYGNKHYLDPDLIDLNFVYGGNGWILDESSTAGERTVLYYNSILQPGQASSNFTDTIKIDDAAATKVTEEVTQDGAYTVITTTYDYNGLQFMIEAEVDAVQTHNAQAAMLSAWGRNVSFSGDTITGIN